MAQKIPKFDLTGMTGWQKVLTVLAILAATVAVIVMSGCATPGQGSEASPATASTAVGAQNVGRTQAGLTSIAMAGDVTYNIDTAGRKDVPDDVKAKLVAGMDQFLKAIEKAQTDDARKAILEGMTKYADTMGRAFGVVIEIKIDGDGAGAGGNIDSAGTSGESGIPPKKEPALPEINPGG